MSGEKSNWSISQQDDWLEKITPKAYYTLIPLAMVNSQTTAFKKDTENASTRLHLLSSVGAMLIPGLADLSRFVIEDGFPCQE